LLYWSLDRSRDERLLVICAGTYCEAGGVRLISTDRTIEYAEAISSRNKVELFASDGQPVQLEGSLDKVEMRLAATEKEPERTAK
jgi:hypothetical protein